jgi:hypothetical protein
MTCAAVRGSAAGLASLPEDDEDRLEAFAHARSCRECARALAEGEQMLALLDGLPAPPSPAPELLQRVAREIHLELEAERAIPAERAAAAARAPWPRRPIAAAAALVVVLAFVALVVRYYHRPIAMTTWLQALVVVALAAGGAALATLSRSAWVPAGILGVSIGFALVRGGPGGIGAHDCTVLELMASGMTLVPLGILVALRRVRGGASTLAAMSGAGALAGQAALDVLCIGRGWMSHLLVFHAGGVLVALVAGATLAQLPGLRAPRLQPHRSA